MKTTNGAVGRTNELAYGLGVVALDEDPIWGDLEKRICRDVATSRRDDAFDRFFARQILACFVGSVMDEVANQCDESFVGLAERHRFLAEAFEFLCALGFPLLVLLPGGEKRNVHLVILFCVGRTTLISRRRMISQKQRFVNPSHASYNFGT